MVRRLFLRWRAAVTTRWLIFWQWSVSWWKQAEVSAPCPIWFLPRWCSAWLSAQRLLPLAFFYWKRERCRQQAWIWSLWSPWWWLPSVYLRPSAAMHFWRFILWVYCWETAISEAKKRWSRFLTEWPVWLRLFCSSCWGFCPSRTSCRRFSLYPWRLPSYWRWSSVRLRYFWLWSLLNAAAGSAWWSPGQGFEVRLPSCLPLWWLQQVHHHQIHCFIQYLWWLFYLLPYRELCCHL